MYVDSAFEVEPGGEHCAFDHLIFYDGTSPNDDVILVSGREKLCGSEAPTTPIRSSGKHAQ